MTDRPDQDLALNLISVSKRFGGVQAVREVDLSVPQGERLALIGPNGAGKTTLFNLIAGELAPDHGSIHMFGKEITRLSVQRRVRLGIGRTYQISELFLDLTVEENLFLAGFAVNGGRLNLLGSWEQRTKEREWARHVAQQVELAPYLETRVAELSHGLQRQLEVGMALATRPRLLMLDEPVSGLSPAERVSMAKLIESLSRDITLILIEHNMDFALDLVDCVAVLHRGEIIADGQPDEIRANQTVQEVYLGTTHA